MNAALWLLCVCASRIFKTLWSVLHMRHRSYEHGVHARLGDQGFVAVTSLGEWR